MALCLESNMPSLILDGNMPSSFFYEVFMSEKPVRPVKDYDKFVVRFPEGMRDAIAERANKNGRSMNSEIVQIIEDALNSRPSSVFIIHDEAHRSSGEGTISVAQLEKIMEDVVQKAIGLTGSPSKKNHSIENDKK